MTLPSYNCWVSEFLFWLRAGLLPALLLTHLWTKLPTWKSARPINLCKQGDDFKWWSVWEPLPGDSNACCLGGHLSWAVYSSKQAGRAKNSLKAKRVSCHRHRPPAAVETWIYSQPSMLVFSVENMVAGAEDTAFILCVALVANSGITDFAHSARSLF